METSSELTLFACGTFFLTGLLTGVWKYLSIWTSPTSEAPRYVTIAHRASLQYSFAALVLFELLAFSPYRESTNLIVVSLPLFFFSVAILMYILHAVLRDTDNQFQKPYRLGRIFIPPTLFHLFVWLLIIGEVGGFLALFVGFLRAKVLK